MTHNKALELKQLRELIIDHDVEYLKYRGSSFDSVTGELIWAKDDALAYHEALIYVIRLIESRLPKELS